MGSTVNLTSAPGAGLCYLLTVTVTRPGMDQDWTWTGPGPELDNKHYLLDRRDAFERKLTNIQEKQYNNFIIDIQIYK